jgi:hypothetical protein
MHVHNTEESSCIPIPVVDVNNTGPATLSCVHDCMVDLSPNNEASVATISPTTGLSLAALFQQQTLEIYKIFGYDR